MNVRLFALCSVFVLAACSSSNTDEPSGSPDSSSGDSSSANDAEIDSGIDSTTESDSGAEVATDTSTADAASDTADDADSTSDAAADSEIDSASDSATDSATDSADDAITDAASETGAPCTTDSECGFGFFCDGPSCLGPGTCTKRPGLGITCLATGTYCGCNGVDFTSHCAAQKASVRIAHDGPC